MGWFVADCIIGIVSAGLSIAGIYTGIKSANVQQELADMHLEEKYGLKAIPKKEEE